MTFAITGNSLVATSNPVAPNRFPHPTTAVRLSEFMPGAPVVDSVPAGWANLVIRAYSLAPGEVCLPPVPDPRITIHMSPCAHVVERSFGSAFSTARIDVDCFSYVPPNHGVTWRWSDNVEVLQIQIAHGFIRQYLQRQTGIEDLEKVDRFGFHDPLMAQIGRACLAELQTRNPRPDALYIDSFAALLSARLVHRHVPVHPDDPTHQERPDNKGVDAAISYIRGNLDKELHLLQLANIANMSVYHFIRQFRRVTGTTPHKYVLDHRISLAQAMLRRNALSIIDIGEKSGFSSHSHFANTFRRLVGTTPTAYRRGKIGHRSTDPGGSSRSGASL